MSVKRTSTSAAVQAVLRKAQSLEIRVGFFENSRYVDGTPVAYIATIHEYGFQAGGIPPRPFMRPTVAEKRPEWTRNVQGALAHAIRAGSVEVLRASFDAVGLSAAADISRTISRITTPPLKESTIAARQRRRSSPGVSTKPLVDSGTLIQSVNSVVVEV